MIGTMSVGYEHINLEECKRREIRVGYTPGNLYLFYWGKIQEQFKSEFIFFPCIL